MNHERKWRVVATLFDYDTNRFSLQPIHHDLTTSKEAKFLAWRYHWDFPDVKVVSI